MGKVQILFTSARSVTIEVLDAGIYETNITYQVYMDEQLITETNKVVESIYGLKPNTTYELKVKYGDEYTDSQTFKTSIEFITLNVRECGAKGDGVQDDTVAIQAAIMSCPSDSRVYVPKGVYKISSLFLKSNITLEIGKDAVLSAFTDRRKFAILPGVIESYDEKSEYNVGSWEGNPLDSYASIITGLYVENVTICGEGTIDGCADFDNWWNDSGTKEGGVFRPRMIYLNHCKSVVVQGITVQNSPSWNIHPYFSNRLRFLNIRVLGPANSHNTDGLDPESCYDVEIAGCFFSVGDDCIAIKSGKIYMGQKFKMPSKKIRIRQSCMRDGHGAVTLGSEIAAGVNDFEVKDCVFKHTDRGLRIKTRRGRGKNSVLDEIIFENIKMDEVKVPFVVNSFYYCDPDGKSTYVGNLNSLPVDERTPRLKNFRFTNISCKNCHFTGAYIFGLPEQKIESLVMEHVDITYCENARTGVAAMMAECQTACRQGIFVKNVKQLTLRDVRVTGCDGKAFILEDIDELVRD